MKHRQNYIKLKLIKINKKWRTRNVYCFPIDGIRQVSTLLSGVVETKPPCTENEMQVKVKSQDAQLMMGKKKKSNPVL